METNLKELNKEEEKLYKKFDRYLKHNTDKEIIAFYKLLNEYVDVQIELEKYCNQ